MQDKIDKIDNSKNNLPVSLLIVNKNTQKDSLCFLKTMEIKLTF